MIEFKTCIVKDGNISQQVVTGKDWKEVLSKITSMNKEAKQNKFEVDLNKYEMVNNPDGSFTFKEKEKVHTYTDVRNYVLSENVNYQYYYDKIEAYIKLYETSLYANSLFKEDGAFIFMLKDGNVNTKPNVVPNFKIGEIPFTSKSSIELALKILGEETIKKALE